MLTNKKFISLALTAAFSCTHSTISLADGLVGDLFNTDPCSNMARDWGRVLGGALGYYLGKEMGNGKPSGKTAGTIIGLLVGDFIGKDIDSRRCALYKIAQKNHLEVAFEDIKPIAPDEAKNEQVQPTGSSDSKKEQKPGQLSRWGGLGHFKPNSSELTPEAKKYFSEIADQYVANLQIQKLENELATQQQAQHGRNNKVLELSREDKEKLHQHYNSIQIVLTGHTDDTGNSELNAKLAEKRAKAVATLFTSRGVPVENLYFQGAGESQPIADNRTEEGRAKNRRVEILEIDSKEKLVEYLRSRKPNIEYYRPRQEEAPIAQNESPAEVENQVAFNEVAPAASKAPEKTAHKKTASKHTKQKQPKNAESESVHTEAARQHSEDVAPTGKTKISQPKNQFMEIDFGGTPATKDSNNEVTASFGEMVEKKQGVFTKLSSLFINEAQASPDRIYSVSCLKDSPRYEGDVLSLKSGKAVEYRTSEYWPGLYQTSWSSIVNGNYVGLTPVGVLRDSAKSVTSPNMLVYIGKDQPGNVKADLKSSTMTQAYQGTGGILYRFYPAPKDAQSSVVCGDIVFPNKAPFEGRSGQIYYRKAGVIYSAEFKPKML